MSKLSKNINPRNDKGEPHGYWEYYFFGTLWFRSFYHNGKVVGYEEYYSSNGKSNKNKYHI